MPWLEAGASLSILRAFEVSLSSGTQLLCGSSEEVVLEVFDLLLQLAASLRLEAIQQVLLQVVQGLQFRLAVLRVQP